MSFARVVAWLSGVGTIGSAGLSLMAFLDARRGGEMAMFPGVLSVLLGFQTVYGAVVCAAAIWAGRSPRAGYAAMAVAFSIPAACMLTLGGSMLPTPAFVIGFAIFGALIAGSVSCSARAGRFPSGPAARTPSPD